MHTAILETPMVVIGAAIGLGTLWDLEILKWVLFGVLYHAVGYGMNSYTDWKKGFDRDDPRKQHHPLNTGDINPETAKIVTYSMLSVMVLYGLYISNFSLEAIIVLTIMLISGVTYNLFGKYMTLKFIPISIAHTSVFILPYAVYSDNTSALVVFLTIAYFIHHIFQIAISGEMKDIDQDEANFLREMGATLHSTPNSDFSQINFSDSITKLVAALSILEIGSSMIGYVIASVKVGDSDVIFIAGMIIFSIMAVWMINETDKLLGPGVFDRERRVSIMSRKELSGFWMIAAAAIPVITFQGWLAIIVVSLLYFLPISKFMWGNFVKPEV